ncbi:hypothetical protein BHE74_00024176, partial [Ensete ventricosum]
SVVRNLLMIVDSSDGLLVHFVRHGTSHSAPYHVLSFYGFPSNKRNVAPSRPIPGSLRGPALSCEIPGDSYGAVLA